MIFNYSWAVWLAWSLAAFFVASGLLTMLDLQPATGALRSRRLSSRIRFFKGAHELATGLAVAWFPTRPLGLLLSLLFCIAIWVRLARHRAWGRSPLSTVLFAVTLLIAWGLRLI